MKLSELALRMGGRLIGSDAEFNGFITDSRDLAEGNVFIAIKGERVDGHDFVNAVIQRGAIATICERTVSGRHILVDDLVSSLAQFGRSLRHEFRGPVIGVTGSNGKTATKEFVTGALSPLGLILKNEGNKNTEYTSPLLWHRLTSETRGVVVEMGMRGFGQIKDLAKISEPTIGVITNIGTAHIEMVGDRSGIARAKAELLQNLHGDQISVLPADDGYFEFLKGIAPGKVISFGSSLESDVRLIGYRPDGWTGSIVRGIAFGTEFEFRISALGRHQAMNAMAAIGAAIACGIDPGLACEGLAEVEALPMRMEVLEWNGITVLVDTYNASPDSMKAAVETLELGPVMGKRVAVLGAMRELGDYEEGGHRLVGKLLAGSTIDKVFLTGGPTRFIKDEALSAGFPSEKIVETDELDLDAVRLFLNELNPGDVVLLKASRALGLEQVLK